MSQRLAIRMWKSLGPRMLPFADAATPELPLGRLLRLAMFQISVGMGLVLLNGTLNRVMIVELGIGASLVSAMVAIPILFAPLRALVGHHSDNYRSALGWRRIPYLWGGTMIQFGGLAILPFAMLVLSGRGAYPPGVIGHVAAALAFLLVGVGLHTTQTAGVALATDLAPPSARPRVVALLYVMLLVGMVASSLIFGALLRSFGYTELIQIVQSAAVITVVVNFVATWKQEPRRPESPDDAGDEPPSFLASFRAFAAKDRARRLLAALGLGAAGFGAQDILLEPYGGELLGLSVAGTTVLTALMAGGTLSGLFVAARWLSRGRDAYHLAAIGALVGIAGFSLVVLAAPFESRLLFWAGTAVIGFGSGWFAVGTLTAAMAIADREASGIAVGAWGAVSATVTGLGIVLGGVLRDVVSSLAVAGALGPGITSRTAGYLVVYQLEILLLFGTLVAIGPLVRFANRRGAPGRFGLADLPT
jgi:BCD family chlorophyll transporter-like MFS transporter